ncbi:ATPase, T2SS/T4P/T4SS family [Escherichia coli]|nr:ATPase, T2SS/T4P/T4SS family [Escherichia coli]
MARLDIAENAYRRMGALRCCWAVGRLTCVSPPCLPPGGTGGAATAGQNQARLTLERLGLSLELTAQLRQLLHKPHGIFLVTGPTGSGKAPRCTLDCRS